MGRYRSSSSSARASARALGIWLFLVGLAAIVVGVVYQTVAANKLPSFMGQVAHETGHRTQRGDVALAVGVVVLIAAGMAFARSRHRHRRH